MEIPPDDSQVFYYLYSTTRDTPLPNQTCRHTECVQEPLNGGNQRDNLRLESVDERTCKGSPSHFADTVESLNNALCFFSRLQNKLSFFRTYIGAHTCKQFARSHPAPFLTTQDAQEHLYTK